jgi:uncharacterized membrane protein
MTRWLYLAIAVTIAALVGSLYVYFGLYDRLAEQLPVHWDINGEPDKFVPKEVAWKYLLLTPGLMIGFVLLTLVLPWLSPKSFEVGRFRDTYGYVMALVVVLFGYIQAVLLWSTLHPESRTARLLVAGILLFFALLGNVLGQVRRNFWMGIRTPWTIASEQVWNQTHRLAGWLFVGFGLLGSAAVLLGAPLLWSFVALMVVALLPVVYSLVLYKRLEKLGKL